MCVILQICVSFFHHGRSKGKKEQQKERRKAKGGLQRHHMTFHRHAFAVRTRKKTHTENDKDVYKWQTGKQKAETNEWLDGGMEMEVAFVILKAWRTNWTTAKVDRGRKEQWFHVLSESGFRRSSRETNETRRHTESMLMRSSDEQICSELKQRRE